MFGYKVHENLVVVTPPAYEPVSRDEVKNWLRVDSSDTNHDAVIDILISAVRVDVENRTHRALIPRTYRLSMDRWPIDCEWGHKIDLWYPPLISVSSVTYLDTDGNRQTLAADQYEVHDESEPAFIVPGYNIVWPSIRVRPDTLQIEYVAGYASGSPDDEDGQQETIPKALRQWMVTKIATLFENREQIVIGTTVTKIPHDFTDGLLDAFVVGTRMF